MFIIQFNYRLIKWVVNSYFPNQLDHNSGYSFSFDISLFYTSTVIPMQDFIIVIRYSARLKSVDLYNQWSQHMNWFPISILLSSVFLLFQLLQSWFFLIRKVYNTFIIHPSNINIFILCLVSYSVCCVLICL